MLAIMNLGHCKLNKKLDADRVDICYAESNLQSAQVCHCSQLLAAIVTIIVTRCLWQYQRAAVCAKRNDDNYRKKFVSSGFGEKGTSSNGRNVAAIQRLLRGYRTVVVPVPETHFQFNAIVQNQLPRSSRNIRAKFTAESVLLAWPQRLRPKLSCPARSQTSGP